MKECVTAKRDGNVTPSDEKIRDKCVTAKPFRIFPKKSISVVPKDSNSDFCEEIDVLRKQDSAGIRRVCVEGPATDNDLSEFTWRRQYAIKKQFASARFMETEFTRRRQYAIKT